MNLKYILVIVILAVFVGGGIIAYQYWLAPKEEIEKSGQLTESKPEEGKGTSPWYSSEWSEFSIGGEKLPQLDTSNWTIREHRYNYSFKYPSEVYKWNYDGGTCWDLEEINPGQKRCDEEKIREIVAIEGLDFMRQSHLTISKKGYQFPTWWPENRNKEICTYQSPNMNVSVYLNLAKLGLSDICQKIGCCTTEPNYEIGGIPAIRCTSRRSEAFKLDGNLDWLSEKSKKWLEKEGYDAWDSVKCFSSINDSITFLYGDYRYEISSFSEQQDKDERAILENILSTFRFLE